MTKEVKLQASTSEKKLKKVKKSGQKKLPKQKPTSDQEKKTDQNKIKKKRDKTKTVEQSTAEEKNEEEEVSQDYELTSNDIEELKKPENKKNVVSKRQVKREKLNNLQQEQKLQSSNDLLDKAWQYLNTWKNNKNEWKFQKVRQVWLTDNLFNKDKVPDNLWEIVIEYFSGSQGRVRNTIIEQSNKIVQEMSDWTEQKDLTTQDNTELDTAKPCEIKYNRARQILQCLQE